MNEEMKYTGSQAVSLCMMKSVRKMVAMIVAKVSSMSGVVSDEKLALNRYNGTLRW
jgi:hypothetical protein